jgi:ABC-type multidrug transport system ATPase subunit
MILDCKISSIRYNDKIVVKDVNFNLDIGNCLMLTGDSGSGKTTLLLAIADLLNSKEAKIEASIKIKENIKIAYVAQNPDANIISGDVKSELLLHSNGDIKQINEILMTFNVSEHLLSKKIRELSSGQKQLITVISSLLHSADLYLFDEPTAMLDNENAQIVSKAIKKLLSIGKTVLISTHNPKKFDFPCQIISLKSKPKTFQPGIFRFKNKDISKYKFEIQNLDFSYNKNVKIFANFNLSLKNGDILLLSGKNGAGKTTLAKLMAGLIRVC